MKLWYRLKIKVIIYLFIFKLDFFKGYDMVDWKFFFFGMERFGLLKEFNYIVNLLFNNIKVSVKFNKLFFEYFRIERGVR